LDSIIRSRAVENRFFAHFFERNNNKTPIAATTTKTTTANEKFNNLTMATARPAGQSPIDEDQAAASGPDGLSFITEPLFVLFI